MLSRSLYLLVTILTVGFAAKATACGGEGMPADVTNAGTEFLVVFMQNEERFYEFPEEYQEIYLASVKDSCEVTITCRAYKDSVWKIKLNAKEALTWRLSDVLDSVMMFGSQYISNLPIHVKATSSIVCYAMNHRNHTADAYLALPRQVAGLEYRVMSYVNSAWDVKQSEFAVAAFEDNTTITIRPSAATANGAPAGSDITVRLDSGQAYQVQSASDLGVSDLTGTSVKSDKPIAVYGGHVRAEVPVGITIPGQFGDPSTSRDHLCEQLPPISAWGKSHVIANFETRAVPDLVRVLALDDNTVIRINGEVWRTLDANRAADTLINGPITVQSDKPTLVAGIARTTETYLGKGDPFMAIVPPVNQTFNDYTFFAPNNPAAYDEHHLMIMTEVSGIGSVALDGTPVPPSLFTTLGTELDTHRYAIANLTVTAGRHDVTSPYIHEKGFVILAYGFGPADSYGYTAGGLYRPIRGIRPVMHDRSEPIGSPKRNEVMITNIITERVFFDSAVVVTKDNAASIGLRERVWQEVGEIQPGEALRFHLQANSSVTEPVSGTVKFYHNTGKWGALETLDVPFTYYPTAAASIADGSSGVAVSVFPTVTSRMISLLISSEMRKQYDVIFVDALGRQVLQTSVIEGEHRLDLGVLPNGQYHMLVRSGEFESRYKIVVQH